MKLHVGAAILMTSLFLAMPASAQGIVD